jgi:hypothetical protein
MLREVTVECRGRSAEVVERQPKAAVDVRLEIVQTLTELCNRQARLARCEFSGRAVLIRGTDEQNFVTCLTQESGMHIGRKQTAGEVAQVLYAADIGQRAGNKVAVGHDPLLGVRGWCRSQIRKTLPPVGRRVWVPTTGPRGATARATTPSCRSPGGEGRAFAG